MPAPRPKTSARIFSVLDPAAEAAVAEVDGEPVGFALWFSTFSTFRGQPGLYLEDIFVKPGFRGRGIGKGLLAAVARRAVERGCGRLEWLVLDWNAPAIGFYQSLGRGPWTGRPFTASMKSRSAGLLRSRLSGEFADSA